MNGHVMLKAADGHELDAYVSRPEGEPIAGLVVVQEIFGVNAHIRSVADGYARDGFLAVAPALFDRIERGVEERLAAPVDRDQREQHPQPQVACDRQDPDQRDRARFGDAGDQQHAPAFVVVADRPAEQQQDHRRQRPGDADER